MRVRLLFYITDKQHTQNKASNGAKVNFQLLLRNSLKFKHQCGAICLNRLLLSNNIIDSNQSWSLKETTVAEQRAILVGVSERMYNYGLGISREIQFQKITFWRKKQRWNWKWNLSTKIKDKKLFADAVTD